MRGGDREEDIMAGNGRAHDLGMIRATLVGQGAILKTADI